MSSSSLTQLRSLVNEALSEAGDPGEIARLQVVLANVRRAQFARSPREPLESLIDERDAADDSIGTVFEMMADGYAPKESELDDLRARRDACQLEIDARRSLVGAR